MIIKIALIAIIFAIIILYLKNVNSEIAMLTAVCASVVLIGFALNGLAEILNIYERIANLTNISESSLKLIIKVTLIAYIVEFTAGIIEEFGMPSLANKLVFVGKIIIVLLAVPIFEAVVKVIEELI